jgi:DNA polymerase/3'-5' exonuclease PolX
MVEKVRAGLGRATEPNAGSLPEAETHARAMVEWMEAGGGSHIAVAGSYRRRRETVGASTCCDDHAESVTERFTDTRTCGSQSAGETRSTVTLRGGCR